MSWEIEGIPKGITVTNGILFRFVGRYMGTESLPREIYGSHPSGNSRFWASNLRVGEYFVWRGSWYQVVVNRVENVSEYLQKYIFFAIPEKYSLREE